MVDKQKQREHLIKSQLRHFQSKLHRLEKYEKRAALLKDVYKSEIDELSRLLRKVQNRDVHA